VLCLTEILHVQIKRIAIPITRTDLCISNGFHGTSIKHHFYFFILFFLSGNFTAVEQYSAHKASEEEEEDVQGLMLPNKSREMRWRRRKRNKRTRRRSMRWLDGW
jgi:hypothetical protein